MHVPIWITKVFGMFSPVSALREQVNLLKLKLADAESKVSEITVERDEALSRLTQLERENEALERKIRRFNSEPSAEERERQRLARINYDPFDGT